MLYVKHPSCRTHPTELKELGFGSSYTGKQKVWEVSCKTDEYLHFHH